MAYAPDQTENPYRSATIAFGTVFALVGVAMLLSFWLRGPERSLQGEAFTPDGVVVLVVDFPGGANLVSFDPSLVSIDQLQAFATNVCGYSIFDINISPRRGPFQAFSRKKRAEFIC